MKELLIKLNYKRQERIALINAQENFVLSLSNELKGVVVDKEIDPRYPYGFVILFVKSVSEVEQLTPMILHNLIADGVLWFCYPKKSSKKYKTDLDRDHGWKTLTDVGFLGVRMIAIDNDWSAFRFRNARFMKSNKK